MSSVGSAEKRNSQDEALRRARETYQEKETDQAKSHSAEMKRMAEAHQSELRDLQETHDKQMEDLKSKTNDAISSRDMRYQKEMEDLRGMHTNRMRQQALEADSKVQKARETAHNEIERTVSVKDQQKEVMAKQYEAQLNDTNKKLESTQNESRTLVQETVGKQRERLNDSHQKELKAVTTDRDRTRDQMKRGYDDLRLNKDTQLRELSNAKQAESARLNQTFETTIREQAKSTQQQLDANREELHDGVERNREHFQKAIDEQKAASQNSNESFKNSIAERTNARLTAGKAQNMELKNELTRQQVSLNRQKNREVQNTKDAMQANIEDLEEKRLETVEAANTKTKSEIDGLQKKNDSLLSRTNRFYQDKIVTDRGLAAERHDRTKMDLEKRLQQSELSGDNRANKLQAINAREEENLRGFFDKTSASQRDNFEDSLRDLRETNKRDQDMIFSNFAKQSNEREMKFQAKLTETNAKYETQIQQLKEGQAKQLQDQVATANKEKKVLVDQKNGEMQRQASQYENRIAKLEETHKREVDEINRRHEDSITSMTRSKGRP